MDDDLAANFSKGIALTGGGTIAIIDTDDGQGTRVIHLPEPVAACRGRLRR